MLQDCTKSMSDIVVLGLGVIQNFILHENMQVPHVSSTDSMQKLDIHLFF